MAHVHLLFLLMCLHFFSSEAEQISKCEGGNYSADSAFGSNVKLLLSNLSSSNSLFSTATTGVSPERVYGLVLCRGDLDPSSCAACYKMLSRNITQLCPYSKEATVWDRKCELRYSDMHFFNSLDAQEVFEGLCNTENSTDTFANMSRELFQDVSYLAAFSSSFMFATGTLSFPTNGSTTVIYSLAQCTGDLSRNLCSQCLNQTLPYYWSTNCRADVGAWFVGYSCNYRYEVVPFYNGDPTVVLSLPPPAAPPTPLAASPTAGEAVSQNRGGRKNTGKVIAVAISLAVGLVLIFALLICFWRRSKKTSYGKMEDILSAESLLFDLRTLKVATDNFSDSNTLGRGGFGAVYKGILPDGQEIAVKRLSTSSRQGLGELKNELLLIAKLQHKNLVRLRGVCLEEEEKLLVYEYTPNRSLDTFLFDPIKRLRLSWERRFEIIGGIARGLRYLHEESHLKVIHRDMKASNILLDENLNPKISDFGLARLFGVDETQNITSRVVGTFGYMAPEYAMRGRFSIKLDVFSFGVLVLEIVSGRKNNHEQHGIDLLSYTWAHWSKDTTLEIVDPTLGEEFSSNEALRCIQIGLLCVQDVPANRPLMSSVVLMLQSPSIAIQPPLQPILGAGTSSTSSTVSAHQSDLSSTDRSASRSLQMSVNGLTISEYHPR